MTAKSFSAKKLFSATAILDASFIAIDWQAPWLSHLNQLDYFNEAISILGHQTSYAVTTANDGKHNYSSTMIAELLNAALEQRTISQSAQTKPILNNNAHKLQFVSQNALPEGEAYESFIASTGKIPTRNNLHDLFNGSIWLTFPKTKAMLNYYHMLEIAKQSTNESRGRVRDTITVFDENGAVLVTSDPSIGEALIDFDWQASLVTPRARFDNPNLGNKKQPKSDAQTAVYIFGHALLEQLIQPRKALCAHSVVINVAAAFFALALPERMDYLDNKLAEHMHALLSQDNITPRQLAPLPILGVPHFWADNADPSFYKDTYVFRSGRRQKHS